MSSGARRTLRPPQACRRRRILSVAVLVLAAPLLLPPDSSAQHGVRFFGGDAESRQLRDRMADMLDAIQAHHVDPGTDPAKLVQGAIRGILDTLDPHSQFLDLGAYRSLRETQDGAFHGLGIIIAVRQDRGGQRRLTVISPVDGMPAKKLGVRPGDVIAAIDGESTEGMNLDAAVGRLRGRKGTQVTITIERQGERFDLDVHRAEIPTESVQHAYMIRPSTGFIRIKDFTKTTAREVREAMARLREQGMERLILDLRDNPGGLLDEAVRVSALFVGGGELVVETRGRLPGQSERHHAPADPSALPGDVPLIVLVNRGSASASEIVAGAIQDHDRGLLVGTTTWGKGLVQSVFGLSGGSGLALTTARYYTPSGRQIQRDYRSSFWDYVFLPGPAQAPAGDEHVTDGGRTVYSGGGIQPDVVVPEHDWHPLVGRLMARSAFFRFAGERALKAPMVGQPTAALPPSELVEFRRFLVAETIEVSDADWEAAVEQVSLQVAYELANANVDLQAGFKVLAESDPQVQAALLSWERASRASLLREARESRRAELSEGGGHVEVGGAAGREAAR